MEVQTIRQKVGKQLKSVTINKNFMVLWMNHILDKISGNFYLVVFPLLVYKLSQSAFDMSIMRIIEIIPSIILGLFFGVIVDRLNRKTLMTITNIIQLITLSFMIFFIYVDQIQTWHVFFLGLILYIGRHFFGVTHNTTIPFIVEKSNLTSANAKLSFTNTLINLIAPSIAGILIALISYEATLLLCLFMLMIILILVQFLSISNQSSTSIKKKNYKEDLKEGLDVIFRNKTLFKPTIIILINNIATSLVLGVLIFYAVDVLGSTEKEVGMILSMAAIGGLIGSLSVTHLKKKVSTGKLFISAIGIQFIGWLFLTFSSSWIFIGSALLIRTFGAIISNVIYNTLRHEITPKHLLGRVTGATSMIVNICLPLGFLVAGIWAEFLPIQWLFIFSTIIIFTSLLIALKLNIEI